MKAFNQAPRIFAGFISKGIFDLYQIVQGPPLKAIKVRYFSKIRLKYTESSFSRTQSASPPGPYECQYSFSDKGASACLGSDHAADM